MFRRCKKRMVPLLWVIIGLNLLWHRHSYSTYAESVVKVARSRIMAFQKGPTKTVNHSPSSSEINPLTFWRFIDWYLVWSLPPFGPAFRASDIRLPLCGQAEKLFTPYIADCHKILLCFFPTTDPVSSWQEKNSIN